MCNELAVTTLQHDHNLQPIGRLVPKKQINPLKQQIGCDMNIDRHITSQSAGRAGRSSQQCKWSSKNWMRQAECGSSHVAYLPWRESKPRIAHPSKESEETVDAHWQPVQMREENAEEEKKKMKHMTGACSRAFYTVLTVHRDKHRLIWSSLFWRLLAYYTLPCALETFSQVPSSQTAPNYQISESVAA